MTSYQLQRKEGENEGRGGNNTHFLEYFSPFQDGYQLGRSLGLWTEQELSTQTLYRWVVPHTPPIHTSRLQENDPPH